MERNRPLDVARSLSMLYIIGFWHLFGYTVMVERMPYGEYLKNATLGTFIFISGYLLSRRYLIEDFKSLKSFYMRRVIRIMPLFALALFSYLVVGFITPRTALLSLTGLSTFIPPQPPTLWFVSLILVFYVLFPLLSGKSVSRKLIIATIIFVVVFIADRLYGGVDRRFIFYWPCFAFGIILSGYKTDELFSKKIVALGTSVIFILLSIVHLSDIIQLPQWLFRSLISLSGTGMVISLSLVLARSASAANAAKHLSFLSMTAYLFHRQIIDLIEKFIFWPQDGVLRIVYLVLVCLPAVLIVSYFIQKVYDLIIDRLSGKSKLTL